MSGQLGPEILKYAYIASLAWTSQDVPAKEADLTLPTPLGRLGCPGISHNILDLGLWDLTLLTSLGHPGMSWGISQ